MDIHVPLEAIAKDVHYAVRGLRRNRGFTAAAILAEDFDELRANGSIWDPEKPAFWCHSGRSADICARSGFSAGGGGVGLLAAGPARDSGGSDSGASSGVACRANSFPLKRVYNFLIWH